MDRFTDLAKGISKNILSPGNRDLPDYPDGTKMTFHFLTETLDDRGEVRSVIDDSKKIGHSMEVILGKQFKMPAWEICLHTMRIDEVAQFMVKKSHTDAYPLVSKSYREFAGVSKSQRKGPCCGMTALTQGVGHKDLDALLVEPCDLKFTIELLKAELPGEYEKESWSMDPEEKLQSIPQLKESGNKLYNDKKYADAAKKYSEALGRLEQLLLREKPGEEEWMELDKMKIPILLNYAQCKLLEKDYYPVIEHTTTVLQKEPENVKALYRRGKAYVGVWDLELAREDFLRVGKIDSSLQATAQKELVNIAALQKQKDDEIKNKLCGKIL